MHKTIVFITHDLNEAVRVGDRIAIMRDGAVVQVGAPNGVVLNQTDSFVRGFTQDVQLHGMVTASSIMDTSVEALAGEMDDPYVVLEDAVLDELMPAGLSATQPLQVVNRAGALVGVIPWSDWRGRWSRTRRPPRPRPSRQGCHACPRYPPEFARSICDAASGISPAPDSVGFRLGRATARPRRSPWASPKRPSRTTRRTSLRSTLSRPLMGGWTP